MGPLYQLLKSVTGGNVSGDMEHMGRQQRNSLSLSSLSITIVPYAPNCMNMSTSR